MWLAWIFIGGTAGMFVMSALCSIRRDEMHGELVRLTGQRDKARRERDWALRELQEADSLRIAWGAVESMN